MKGNMLDIVNSQFLVCDVEIIQITWSDNLHKNRPIRHVVDFENGPLF